MAEPERCATSTPGTQTAELFREMALLLNEGAKD